MTGSPVLAYLEPTAAIPLLSTIVAAIGVALAFGKKGWTITAAASRSLVRLVRRK